MSEENPPKQPATTKKAPTRAANGNRQAKAAPAGVRKTLGAKGANPTKSAASGAKNDGNSQTTKKDPTIVVKKFSPVYVINSECSESNCLLCRNQLSELCNTCHENGSTDCPVSKGVCNHQFHLHCLTNWLKKNTLCPMTGCNVRWQNA